MIFRKLSANSLQVLTLSNLGDSMPLSNLRGRWNLPKLNNSRFPQWILIKSCIALVHIKQFECLFLALLNERRRQSDVTKNSVTMLGCRLRKLSELNNSRFLFRTSIKFCMVVAPHKTNLA